MAQVALGQVLHQIDELLPANSLPWDDIFAAVLLVFFGIKTLLVSAYSASAFLYSRCHAQAQSHPASCVPCGQKNIKQDFQAARLLQDAKDADESAAEEREEAEKEVVRLGDGAAPFLTLLGRAPVMGSLGALLQCSPLGDSRAEFPGTSKLRQECCICSLRCILFWLALAGEALGFVLSTFTLVFLAEWGDKSFLATIALAAASSPAGVVLGAVGGHGVATGIAVVGGSYLSRFLSERVVAYVGGSLFLVFAASTILDIVGKVTS